MKIIHYLFLAGLLTSLPHDFSASINDTNMGNAKTDAVITDQANPKLQAPVITHVTSPVITPSENRNPNTTQGLQPQQQPMQQNVNNQNSTSWLNPYTISAGALALGALGYSYLRSNNNTTDSNNNSAHQKSFTDDRDDTIMEYLNPDGSERRVITKPNGTKFFSYKNPNTASERIIAVEPNGSKRHIQSYPDNNSKQFSYFKPDGSRSTKVIINGSPTSQKMYERSSFVNNANNTLYTYHRQPGIKTTHVYYPDTTKRSVETDLNTKMHLITDKAVDGTQVSTDQNELLKTAYHEAGHALAAIFYNTADNIIEHATMKANGDVLGHVAMNGKYLVQATIQELEAKIISDLSGGIAEQLYYSKNMLTDKDKILKFYNKGAYATDIKLAHRSATAILVKKSENINDDNINQIITDLYPQAYQFIASHKQELQKIAHALITHETVSKADMYHLLDLPVPLMDIEEGPLPKELLDEYQLRGWHHESTTPRAPLLFKNTDIDPRRTMSEATPDGSTIETFYTVNGHKYKTVQTNPDKTIISTLYNGPQGNIIKQGYSNADQKLYLIKEFTDENITTFSVSYDDEEQLTLNHTNRYKYGYDQDRNYVGRTGTFDKNGNPGMYEIEEEK